MKKSSYLVGILGTLSLGFGLYGLVAVQQSGFTLEQANMVFNFSDVLGYSDYLTPQQQFVMIVARNATPLIIVGIVLLVAAVFMYRKAKT